MGSSANRRKELSCRERQGSLQAPLSMNLEARVTPIWKRQKLFIAILLIGYGAYFYYDGAVGWPRNNERFAKYQEFAQADNLDGWNAFAKERGWSNEKPEKAYTESEIQGQYLWGSLCMVPGLIALGYWMQQIRRSLKLDDEAVTSPAGTRVPFGAITGLGLKKWESKGLARVRYEVGGRKGEFVVDDYKFETETTKKILEEIKRQLESRATAS
jgi:hypothetical protein